MGPTWVLSAPDGPHVGPMNLAIRGPSIARCYSVLQTMWCPNSGLVIPLAQWGILVSLRPSICLSVRPSVRPASRVRSVVPTVLVGSISYLHILSSNRRWCVACKDFWLIKKFKILAIFYNLYLWLCLVLAWDLMWFTSMGNHGAAVGISEWGRSSCSSFQSAAQQGLSQWEK